MANKVVYIFQAIDRYTNIARKVNRVTDASKRSFAALDRKMKSTSKSIEALGRKTQKLGRATRSMGADLTFGLTAAIGAVGTMALRESGKIEQLGIAFNTMVGDADKADKLLKGLIQFTATTPFQLDEVASSAQMLLSFGFAADEVLKRLRQIGDLAAGTSRPLNQFALTLGQIRTAGKLTGQETRELAFKGVGAVELLAKKFNVSGEVITKAISKGLITFEVFDSLLTDLTKKGGRFGGLTEKQSKSLFGLFTTLKDAGALAFKELGDQIIAVTGLKGLIASLIVSINNFTKSLAVFAQANPKLTKFLIIAAGVLAVLGPVLIIAGQLAISIGALTIFFAVFGGAIAAAAIPILAIVAAIGLAIAFFDELKLMMTDFIEFVFGFAAKIQEIFESGFLQLFGESIVGGIQSFAGALGSVNLATGAPTGGGGATSDVNINLNAPKGAVQSVKKKTSGKTSGLNVGVNVKEAL